MLTSTSVSVIALLKELRVCVNATFSFTPICLYNTDGGTRQSSSSVTFLTTVSISTVVALFVMLIRFVHVKQNPDPSHLDEQALYELLERVLLIKHVRPIFDPSAI